MEIIVALVALSFFGFVLVSAAGYMGGSTDPHNQDE
jgi:hypothetical protein